MWQRFFNFFLIQLEYDLLWVKVSDLLVWQIKNVIIKNLLKNPTFFKKCITSTKCWYTCSFYISSLQDYNFINYGGKLKSVLIKTGSPYFSLLLLNFRCVLKIFKNNVPEMWTKQFFLSKTYPAWKIWEDTRHMDGV